MGQADREEEQCGTKPSGEGVSTPWGRAEQEESEFVCVAGSRERCVCVCDLVVADQSTKGSSEEDAGEWEVCEAETHKVGNNRGSCERLGRAGLTFI